VFQHFSGEAFTSTEVEYLITGANKPRHKKMTQRTTTTEAEILTIFMVALQAIHRTILGINFKFSPYVRTLRENYSYLPHFLTAAGDLSMKQLYWPVLLTHG